MENIFMMVSFTFRGSYPQPVFKICQSKGDQNYSSITSVIFHCCRCTLNPRPFPRSKAHVDVPSETVPSCPKLIFQFFGQSLLLLQSFKSEENYQIILKLTIFQVTFALNILQQYMASLFKLIQKDNMF